MQQQDEQGADEWMSISGAAKRLGISRQAVQDRVRRRRIPTREDNRGNTQVLVSLAAATSCKQPRSTGIPTPVELASVSAKPVAESPVKTQQGAADEPERIPLSTHREVVEALQRAFGELSASHHRQLAAERRRADLAEARLAEPLSFIERLIGRHIVSPYPELIEDI